MFRRSLLAVALLGLVALISAPYGRALAGTPAGHCLALDSRRGPNEDTWVNSCEVKVNVKWFDDRLCKTGCADVVPARGAQGITPITGSARWAACVYPDFVNYEWKGVGAYLCR
jgi:hypothetical protein